jgi:F0F1-type ATP synthase membrane subunit b/b'
MVQRNAFLLAGAITAFLLLLIGGLVQGVTQQASLQENVANVANATSTTQTLDPTAQALLLEREAAYQQALAEAAARIEQANQQLAQINSQSFIAPAQPASPRSPEQAVGEQHERDEHGGSEDQDNDD